MFSYILPEICISAENVTEQKHRKLDVLLIGIVLTCSTYCKNNALSISRTVLSIFMYACIFKKLSHSPHSNPLSFCFFLMYFVNRSKLIFVSYLDLTPADVQEHILKNQMVRLHADICFHFDVFFYWVTSVIATIFPKNFVYYSWCFNSSKVRP